MSGTGESRADFAGEERAFRIRLGEIRRIEAKCGVGVGEICRRLARAALAQRQNPSILNMLASGIEIYAADVREVLYQGLIGGGMASGEATKLVASEIDDRGLQGLLDNAATALLVLVAAGDKPETDTEGERQAGASASTPPNP